MHKYIFNVTANTTIKLYGIGETDWGDGNTDSLNEHTFQSSGLFNVMTNLHISDRKTYESDETTRNSLLSAEIDLSILENKENIFVHMFNNCTKLINFSFVKNASFDCDINFSYMFNNCNSLNKITNFDFITSGDNTKIVDMQSMFNNCYELVNSPTFDNFSKTSNKISFNCMYRNCKKLVNAYVPKTNNMAKAICTSMFEGCEKLKNVYNLINYSIINSRSMFFDCSSIVSAPAMFLYDCKDASFMFQSCYSLVNIHNASINFTNVLDMYADNIDYNSIKFFTPQRCRRMFAACYNLRNIELGYMNLNNIISLEERRDIIMDEYMFGKLHNDCIIKNHTPWNMPINYKQYGIESKDNPYIYTLEEAKDTFKVVHSQGRSNISDLYICTKVQFPGILFVDPMDYIEENIYYTFKYDSEIKYDTTVGGTDYPLCRKLAIKDTLKDDFSESTFNMYVYENGKKSIFNEFRLRNDIEGYRLLVYSLNDECELPLNYNENERYYIGLPRLYHSSSLGSSDYTVGEYYKVLIEEKDGTITNNLNTLIKNINKVYLYYPEDTKSIKFYCHKDSTPNQIKEIISCDGVVGEEYMCTDVFCNCPYLEKINPDILKSDNNVKCSFLASMFYNCKSLKSVDLSSLNVIDDDISISYMFYNCESITSYKLPQVNIRNASYAFYGCKSLIDPKFNELTLKHSSGNIDIDLSYTFANSGIESIDLTNLNKDYPFDIKHIFDGCSNLKNVKFGRLDNLINLEGAFKNCTSLENLDLTTLFYTELTGNSNLTNTKEMFMGCTSLRELNLSTWSTGNVTEFTDMFKEVPYDCRILIHSYRWDVNDMTEYNTSFDGYFIEVDSDEYYIEYEISSIDAEEINADNQNKYIPRFTNTDFTTDDGTLNYKRLKVYMKDGRVLNYYVVDSVSTILEAKLLTTDIYKIIAYYFYDTCLIKVPSYVTKINFHNIDNITSFEELFLNCKYLKNANIEINKNVNSLKSMFKGCTLLQNLSIRSWDTSRVTDMSDMFNGCTSLTSLELLWDTTDVTDMSYMFNGCTSLTYLDLNTFDTRNVLDGYRMFKDVNPNIEFNHKINNSNSVNYTFFKLTERDTTFNNKFPWSNSKSYVEYYFKDSIDLLLSRDYDYSWNNLSAPYKNIPAFSTLPYGEYNEYSYDYDKIEIILNDDTVINSFEDAENLYTSDIKLIRLYYPDETTKLTFGIYKDRQFNENKMVINYITSYNMVEMNSMFAGITISKESKVFENLYTGKCKTMRGMFENSKSDSLGFLGTARFDASEVLNTAYMFYNFKSNGYPHIPLFNTNKVLDMSYMFYHTSDFNYINRLDTSSVVNMSYMFYGYVSTEINLYLVNFDTSKVLECENMLKNVTVNKVKVGSKWNLHESAVGYDGQFEYVL